MQVLEAVARPFVVFVERYYPDAFVFAIVLTLVTFVMAISMTETTALEATAIWGDGLPVLLAFIAQLSLTLITAHALAHTDAVQGLIGRLARTPRSEFQAYFLVVLVAGLGSLFAWSLGLVAGALIAQRVAVHAPERGLSLHYPLLVASAYGGFVVWHMGYSSSAALFVATPGHVLEATTGIIPVTQTIFSSWNVLTALIALAVVSTVCPLMRPARRVLLPETRRQELLSRLEASAPAPRAALALGARIERQRWITLVMGLVFLLYLGGWFVERGLELTLDIVNWSFLALGLVLCRSPLHYVRLIGNASGAVGPIILQYPFYAGIMTLMTQTELVSIISDWFTAISTPQTLGFWAFVSGGVVNFFIPSGGGQWSVQGPIFIEAAQNLGVGHNVIVMGVAYGDQWSNMIQPFWTIPLLAIAGLHMRQIMGYTFVVFAVTFFVFGAALLLVGAG